ncbi:thermonuclease family protein [Benzoatithermus flavus]|uniref:TNase-like domain-containing protein n=1 Tax=Benzoatithermus flavus TaxID=3108223 RepID=A0ABU8XMR5_9PROT
MLGLAIPDRWAAAAEIVDGLATVREDGTLSVGGTAVRLFGISIPQIERTCRTFIRPPRCAPKAVLVLDGKVNGFVRCEIVRRGADGVLEGVCSMRGRDLFGPGEDLAAWLVQEGFAFAAPDAPPDYAALERLAQSRELGLWGDKFLNLR